MEQNKINIEIKKMDKKTKNIEWTETLEIPYEKVEKQVQPINPTIEEEQEIQNSNLQIKEGLINTRVLDMKLNPFHQPSMNTYEFEDSETKIIATITKNNGEPIESNEEIKALEKLLENKIITEKEFEKKKELILNRKNKED